jgi:hypothetical protein
LRRAWMTFFEVETYVIFCVSLAGKSIQVMSFCGLPCL